MTVSIELYLKEKSSNFLNTLILFIMKLPDVKRKNSLIESLKKSRKKLTVNLFASNKYLIYVCKKKLSFENHINDIENLVCRGSNSDYSFIPGYVPNSFNIGLISSDLYTTYHLYENYKNRLTNLNNLIVFLNIPSPGYSLVRTSERYRAVALKYFFNINYESENYIIKRYEKWIFGKCKKLNKVDIPINYMGYENKSQYSNEISAKQRAKTHLRENLREPDQMLWIYKLIELAKTKNVRVILIIPPIRSDFKNELPVKEKLFSKFYKLELDNVKLLDLYDSNCFDDSDFGDTDHVNESGAIKISKLINEFLINEKYL
jgi:hypothetical protein